MARLQRTPLTDLALQNHIVPSSLNWPDTNIAFDRMTEEDLLAGIEGLVPPEKSDEY
jgi:hypothetical protein